MLENTKTLIAICFVLVSCACYPALGLQMNKDFFKKHLATNVYALDTEAGAIVLYEGIEVNIGMENTGNYRSYTQTETVHRIIKILRSDALKEAQVVIALPKDGKHYYVSKLAASAYNLSGNDVIETKLPRSDIYEKAISDYFFEYTFSFPGVKEGTIIEYTYEQVSPVETFLPRWMIQGNYPKLMTEYRVSYPDAYAYTTITHVTEPLKEFASVADAQNSKDDFCEVKGVLYGDRKRFEAYWLRRNVRAVRSEPHVITLANFMENLEFRMTSANTDRSVMHMQNTWEQMNDALVKSERFGGQVFAQNKFLDAVVDSISRANPGIQGKIVAMYNFVRANVRSTGIHRIYIRDDLQDVFDKKEGTESEVNLLLVSMLVHAGIPAAPLILSTQGSLSPSPAFPMENRFNYTVCIVTIDSNYVFLDASNKNNVLGLLPSYCYNGYARIIKKDGRGIYLDPGLVKERTAVSVKLDNFTDTSADFGIILKMGLQESSDHRKTWAKSEKGNKSYLGELKNSLPSGMTVIHSNIENEYTPDTNLVVVLTGIARFNKDEQGDIFISSDFLHRISSGAFKAASRVLPIEFAHQLRYHATTTIVLPGDMLPVDLPKPVSLSIESGHILYDRVCNYNPDLHILTSNSSYDLNATNYPPGSYPAIRSFYNDMAKDQGVLITLRKTTHK